MDWDYLEGPEFWQLAPVLLAQTAAVFTAGRALGRRIGHGSEARRRHGGFVFRWAVLGHFVGWCSAPLVFGPLTGASARALFEMSVFAAFGMLGGWLVGTLHGAAVLAWQFRRTQARKPPPAGR